MKNRVFRAILVIFCIVVVGVWFETRKSRESKNPEPPTVGQGSRPQPETTGSTSAEQRPIETAGKSFAAVAEALSGRFSVSVKAVGILADEKIQANVPCTTVKETLDRVVQQTPNAAWFLTPSGTYLLFSMRDPARKEFLKAQ